MLRKGLLEHTSYDELDAEGRGKSRLLPLKLAIQRLKGKENKITVPLKTDRDYHTFYQQLVRAGSKISIPNAKNEEIGPQKFEQCFNLLGIEDSTDLQDLIADPVYREIFEREGIKFSFSKEMRNETRRVEARAKAEGQLEEIGITYAGEGESWEWGDNSDADFCKGAPEGRQIWVIRSHYYEDGFPCMFLYPIEGVKISDYSTALDKFYMNLSTDAGYMKMHVDTKKFNPLWVACPCYYDWFLKHPQPEDNETLEQIEAEEAQRAAEETDYDYRMAESAVGRDRKKLRRLVEAYGKEDVLKFVRSLNEGLYDNEHVVGSVHPSADPEGYLDGVTDIEGCERCPYDLFIVFAKGKGYYKSLDNIVYVGPNDEEHDEINWEYRHNPSYICYGGHVFDGTYYGGEKILQIYLS